MDTINEDVGKSSNPEQSIPKKEAVCGKSDGSELIQEASFENKVELVLSRKTYKNGGTVVGTVQLKVSSENDVKDYFVRAQLYVAGRCCIDDRWHDSTALRELYRQTHPCHSVLPLLPQNDVRVNNDNVDHNNCTVEECVIKSVLGSHSSKRGRSTVCVWSTDVVDLLSCPKRKYHDDKKRTALVMAGSDWHNTSTAVMSKMKDLSTNQIQLNDELLEEPSCDLSHFSENSDSNDLSFGADDAEDFESSPLETIEESLQDKDVFTQNQIDLEINDGNQTRNDTSSMAFTFRVDLPNDIPPTVNTETVRYFYSAVLVVKTKSGQYNVVQAPFTLVATSLSSAKERAGRVQIGTCEAVSISDELPCHISPTTNMLQTSKTSVITQKECINSMRISNAQGIPCCMLTVIWDRQNELENNICLYQGAILLLRFDFFNNNSELESDGEILSCAQVCACLQGEEFACYENKPKKRTRIHILDSDYDLVEHGCTDSLSIRLRMPIEHEIYTFHTDLVQVLVRCKIDLTVSSDNGENFSVLSLELPCQVSTHLPDESVPLEDDENNVYNRVDWRKLEDTLDKGNLVTQDIMNDLTMLSLHMLDNT